MALLLKWPLSQPYFHEPYTVLLHWGKSRDTKSTLQMCTSMTMLYHIDLIKLLINLVLIKSNYHKTQRIISKMTINYFILFKIYMSILKSFFGVENMCHISAEKKKNLGNLCQKSISKCNAIYSWKKSLLWWKFHIFQCFQFPTYYIKYYLHSRTIYIYIYIYI